MITPGLCQYCDEPKLSGERLDPTGVFHIECLIRMIMGPAAHMLKECSCYGGAREDPPGMTKRQAASLAYDTARIVYPGE